MTSIVIVGNGPAGHRIAQRLRQEGHDGPVRVLGAEKHAAYNRVLLGSLLDRTLEPEAVRLPDLPGDVRVQLGVTVTGIDRLRRVVHTDAGFSQHYDRLVLATGSHSRVPEIPGLRADGGELAPGVATLRTLADCERIMRRTGRVVVLGGGVLGVEAARGLAGHGVQVSLVHSGAHLMDRQLDAASGKLLAARLGELGVGLRLGRRAVRYRTGAVVLDDGETLRTDTVVLCVGVTPATAIAEQAGLFVRQGVVVDDLLRTSDSSIHAIGDCAEHDAVVPGLIGHAWAQADVLAKLLTGSKARYRGTPVVTRLKARGIDLASVGSVAALGSSGTDAELVTLSDPARGRYAKLALRDERVVAAVLLGLPRAIAAVSQLHDRDLPVPSDRLGLLLGTATTASQAPVDLPDDAVICRCNNVTKQALAHAWKGGARDVPGLVSATRATTGCGGCADAVRRVCETLRTGPQAALTEQEGAA